MSSDGTYTHLTLVQIFSLTIAIYVSVLLIKEDDWFS